MEILLAVVLFGVGLALIVKGGDVFVDAATWMAEVTGIPKFLIGATVVSLATTLPELLVSWMATARGSVELAIGNAVGSVTANTGLILGVSVLCMPAVVEISSFRFKGLLMMLATAVLGIFCWDGTLGLLEGLLLYGIVIVFMVHNVREGKTAMTGEDQHRQDRPDRKTVVENLVRFVIGAAAIVFGANLLVRYGSELARILGVSEKIIGLTMVAIGTSLPELVTTITAIVKREASMSVGNILGANIIDMTLILATCTLVSGGTLTVSPSTVSLDIPVSLLCMAIAIVPTLLRKRFSRIQGVALLAS